MTNEGVSLDKPKILILVGPTAIGKSRVALMIAEKFKGEIVNGDSMQVYRYMDIGTAKPSEKELGRVRHHLIDIRNPDEDFDAARFRDEASKAITDIKDRGLIPIVVGGTGLYIKALTEGVFNAPPVDKELRERLRREAEESGISVLYNRLTDVDQEAAARIPPNNTHRVIRALEIFYQTGRPISQYQREHAFSERPYNSLKIGLYRKRETIYKNIDDRVESMIKAGFVDEVERILKMGYSHGLKAMQAIGYAHICNHLQGEYDLEEAIRLIKRDTRHYAKRQMTWFGRDHDIRWFDMSEEVCLEHIFDKVRGFIGQAV